MRYAFVLNPAARGGRARHAAGRLADLLRTHALDATLDVTAAPGDARRLAAERGRHADAVVAVGGDGTVHEVASGLVGSGSAAALGLLPLGTGNDFAKMVRMPRGLDAAFAALLAARVAPADYGTVRWREAGRGAAGGHAAPGARGDGAGEDAAEHEAPFFNAVGIGFDARVAAEAPRFKRVGGTAAYLAAALSVLRAWRAPHARVVLDGRMLLDGPLLLATAANGVSSGGGFYLTPDARIDDGLLDVCVICDVPVRRVLTLLPLALAGRHARARPVAMARGAALTLDATAPVAIHADGEVLTRAAVYVTARVMPGALRVLMAR